MRIFIDTWGWVTLCDQTRTEYQKAHDFFWERVRGGYRFYTSNFVLGETITFLFTRFKSRGERFLDETLEIIRLPRFKVEEITPERFQQTIAMRRRYKDKPEISFTDLSSMVLMKELRIQEVFTGDQHFAKVNLGFRLVPTM